MADLRFVSGADLITNNIQIMTKDNKQNELSENTNTAIAYSTCCTQLKNAGEYRSKIELHNVDCLPFMKQCEDKQFDLAIVDPPYGIGYSGRDGQKTIEYDNKKKWDNKTPSQEYSDAILNLIEDTFDKHYGAIYKDDNLLSIHTGGWSVNEALIEQLEDTVWWVKYHRATIRGGHYFFEFCGDFEWDIIKKYKQ